MIFAIVFGYYCLLCNQTATMSLVSRKSEYDWSKIFAWSGLQSSNSVPWNRDQPYLTNASVTIENLSSNDSLTFKDVIRFVGSWINPPMSEILPETKDEMWLSVQCPTGSIGGVMFYESNDAIVLEFGLTTVGVAFVGASWNPLVYRVGYNLSSFQLPTFAVSFWICDAHNVLPLCKTCGWNCSDTTTT